MTTQLEINMSRLLASLLLAVSLPTMAQIYEYTDAEGNKAYTNQPPPTGVTATPVELEPTNVVDVPDIPPPAAPAPAPPATAPNNPQPTETTAVHDAPDEDDDQSYDTYYNHPSTSEVNDAVRRPRAVNLPAGVGGPAGGDGIGADPGVGRPGGAGHAGGGRGR